MLSLGAGIARQVESWPKGHRRGLGLSPPRPLPVCVVPPLRSLSDFLSSLLPSQRITSWLKVVQEKVTLTFYSLVVCTHYITKPIKSTLTGMER